MADPEQPKARGKPLERSAADLEQLSRIDDHAAAEGRTFWRAHAPARLRDLPDAKPDAEEARRKRDRRREAAILWLIFTRVYRLKGAVVSRQETRAAVDAVADAARARARAIGEKLRAGSIDLPAWQREMETLIRTAHAAAGTIGAGGVASLGAADRKALAKRVRFQLRKLGGFARELGDGLPLDGAFLARAEMYAGAAVGAYEAILRAGDARAGYRWERRIRHASESCDQCIGYEAQGWQPIGTLPNIGEECSCLSNCRCSFERSKAKKRPEDLSMPTDLELFDRERCARRRRHAARLGVNAIPLRALAAPDEPPPGEPRLVAARGMLAPADPGGAATQAAADRINAVLGFEGDRRLLPEQLHIRTLEAGNSNLIPSKWMFLDRSTLKNVAGRAAEGFAFMNSHRTGGLSSPAELPYGRTFAGRLETWALPGGETFHRSLVQVYMLKGERPNGENGPSTDALAAGIDAGTIFDVSLGLKRGYARCDVCGNDLEARGDGGERLCSHYPGSTYKMSRDEKTKQSGRGVPGGRATFSLVDSEPGEVSAVFDGAVPGAGFRLAVESARLGLLPPVALAELRGAYRDLLPDRGRAAARFHQTAPKGPSTMTLRELLQKIGLAGAAADPDLDLDSEIDGDDLAVPRHAPAPAPAQAPPKSAPDPQLAELKALLAEERQARLAAEQARKDEARANQLGNFRSSGRSFTDGLKAGNKLNGQQAGALPDLYVHLATDDADRPIDGYSRVETLKTILSASRSHDLTRPVVASREDKKPAGKPSDDSSVLSSEGDGGYDPVAAARKQNDEHFAHSRRKQPVA